MIGSKNNLLESFLNKNLTKIVGCHNPLSAKLGEESGFDAVWFSGFEYSTSMCLPDANILTMSNHLSVISSITRSINIPLVADCDSGFGDANNVAHMVKEYEYAGVSALCIEDKLFPKINSFCDVKQQLISIKEFCLKLISASEAKHSKEFMVIARLESFIAGHGVKDAVSRARAYVNAGADALLVHSKMSDTTEIEEFISHFDLSIPIIIIPTTYYKITVDEIHSLSPNIKAVIYANQGIRATIRTLKEVYTEILSCGSSASVEDHLASVKEAFVYQKMQEHIQNYETWERILKTRLKNKKIFNS